MKAIKLTFPTYGHTWRIRRNAPQTDEPPTREEALELALGGCAPGKRPGNTQ